jgi:glycerol uptake facilitator-like aquaporin
MKPGLGSRVFAEFLGTAFLVAAVVGSGIMAERLCGGNVGLALLANTIATGAALVALILTFGPISGAQFNPVVTVADAMAGQTPWAEAIPYIAGQVGGGCLGTVLANAMFGLRLVSISHRDRGGMSQLLSEFVATFGLVCVIWGCSRTQPRLVAFAVGYYITAAYWFTASTSFANPAVTVARTLRDTFAGIQPANIPGFIAVQFVGGVAATLVFRWLEPKLATEPGRVPVPINTRTA